MATKQGTVTAVSCNDTYAFTKPVRRSIVLEAGIGVVGDVHAGVHVRHRGRVRADPTQPNLRQVHLIPQEVLDEVGSKGYPVAPGELGENVTTTGVDLLGLPRGTILRFGTAAGRSPDGDQPLAAVLAAAAATSLDESIAGAVAAVAAAAERDTGDDPRPAVIVAGLRNPCAQINNFQDGLLKEMLGRDDEGRVVRKAGVMAVVLRGGAIHPGERVTVELPPPPHVPLDRV